MTGDEQILLQEITRLLVVLSLRRQEQDHEQVFKVFTSIFDGFTQRYSDFVYTFLGHFYSAIKKSKKSVTLYQALGEYLAKVALPSMLAKNEKYCKVTEELLKLAYRVTKFSPTPTADQHETLTHSLFALMSRFPTNPSILSHILKLLSLSVWHAMTLKTAKSLDLYSQVTNLIAEYSPMSHKEQVRIAVSKSLARLLPLLSEKDDALFPGQLKMLQSLILLLNDEQPDIRYYLCESEALIKVIDHQGTGKWNVMEENVRLNDQVVVEYLFEEFTDRVKTAQPHLLSQYAQEFLYNQWIVGNPYREHLSKNFEDKIFFFEPVNKFYDLLWVKRLAYKQLA